MKMFFKRLKPIISIFLVVFLMLGCFVFTAYGESSHSKVNRIETDHEGFVPNQLIIKYKITNESQINSFQRLTEKSINARVIKELPRDARLLELPKDKDIKEIVQQLSKDPNIEYVEPNYYVYALEASTQDEGNVRVIERDGPDFPEPNDPFYFEQFGPQLIKAPYAWSKTDFNSAAVVAVIDTGVQGTHPDLQGVILSNGYNFVENNGSGAPYDSGNTADDHGHGTHVSGIISAIYNNNIGIAGVTGPADVQILPIKVLNDLGRGTSYDVSEGIRYAANEGADVINLSLGSSTSTRVEEEAVAYAQAKGCVVVAAAGNDSGRVEFQYPASYPGVIAVGAVDNQKRKAYFSNYGDRLDISAPGVDILSTVPDFVGRKSGDSYGDDLSGYYEKMSGTSMAAPHVAAVAALYKCVYPDASVLQICEVLTSTAEDIGDIGKDPETGHGLVDVAAVMGQEPIKKALAFRAPREGQSIFGTTAVRLQIGMLDQIDTIEMYLDEIDDVNKIAEIDNEGEAMITYEWDTIGCPEGEHNIIAIAKSDIGEQIGKTESLRISINNEVTSGLRLEVVDLDGNPAASATAYMSQRMGSGYDTNYYFADENGFIRVPDRYGQHTEGYDVMISGVVEKDETAYRFIYNHKFDGPGWYQINGENTVRVTPEMYGQDSEKLDNPLYCISPLDLNNKRKTTISPWRETEIKTLYVDPGAYELCGFWSSSLPGIMQADIYKENSPTYFLKGGLTIVKDQENVTIALNTDNAGKIVTGIYEEQDSTILYLKLPEESEYFGIPFLYSGLKGEEIILPPGEYEVSADVKSIRDGDEWEFYFKRDENLVVEAGLDNPLRVNFGKNAKISEFSSKTGSKIEKGRRLETINKITDEFGNSLAYAYGPRYPWSTNGLLFIRKELDNGEFKLYEWSPGNVGGFNEVDIEWSYRNDPVFSVHDSAGNEIYNRSSSFDLNGSIWDTGRDYTVPLPPGPGNYQARLAFYAGPLSGEGKQFVQETMDFEIIVPEGKETVDIVVRGPSGAPVNSGEVYLYKWEENGGWQHINKNKRLVTDGNTGLVKIPTNLEFSSQNINLAVVESRMYSLAGFSVKPFSTIHGLDELNLSDVKPVEVSISDDFGNDLTNNANSNKLKMPVYSDGGGRLSEPEFVTEVTVTPLQGGWNDPYRIYLEPGIHKYCYTTFNQGLWRYLIYEKNIQVPEGGGSLKLNLDGKKTASCEIKGENIQPKIILQPDDLMNSWTYDYEIPTAGKKYFILGEGRYSPIYKLESNVPDTNIRLEQIFEMGEKELKAGEKHTWRFDDTLETEIKLEQNEVIAGDNLTGNISFHDGFGNRLAQMNKVESYVTEKIYPSLVVTHISPEGEEIECIRKESEDFFDSIHIKLPNNLQPGTYRASVELPFIETAQISCAEFTVKKESGEPAEPRKPIYEVIPIISGFYDIYVDQNGICILEVKDEAGFKYFAVDIESVVEHTGPETVVFVHIRDRKQLELNAIKADFDIMRTAKSGFSINKGDIIKVYVVDELTNDIGHNPIIFH